MSTIQDSLDLSRCLKNQLVRLCVVLLVTVCFALTATPDKNVRFPDDIIVFPNEDNFKIKDKRSETSQEYREVPHFSHNSEFHKLQYQELTPPFPLSRRGHSDVPFGHSEEFHRTHGFRNIVQDSVVFKNQSQDIMIPLEFIQNINQVNNLSDILLNYVEGEEEINSDPTFLTDRFSQGERNAAITPKPAVCKPELQTVKLAESDDASVLYIPQCTRLERCGGCCSHHLLSCQPTEVEPVSFSVMKTQYTGGTRLKFVGKEIILMEKHTKCKCDCKIKAEDCNRFQQYRKSECRCVCKNNDEEKKCYRKNQTKLWDPNLCSCICREITPCSTGFEFDPIECKCAAVPTRTRYSDADPRVDYDE